MECWVRGKGLSMLNQARRWHGPVGQRGWWRLPRLAMNADPRWRKCSKGLYALLVFMP